ncbi:hypothetical protein [Hymenobacter rubidus]|uniref:hypothetical protein n=1 Tax=Hymenobacter rubidus TaxID=1441626 RepID=UPI00191E2076|nr:hypothetical protein [Hymenobacter rubidus]
MRLPALDQRVLLERGEAGVLAAALGVLVRDVTHATRPVPLLEAIALPALSTLATRLGRLHQRERAAPPRPGQRPRPRAFRVSYDQLAVLLHYRLCLPYCGLGALGQQQVQVVVGKFQQQALNLEHLLRIPT